jgi:hypothetical protein
MSLDELTQLHTHVGKHLVDRKEARIKELQAELWSLGAKESDNAVMPRVKGPRVIGNGRTAGGELDNAKRRLEALKWVTERPAPSRL